MKPSRIEVRLRELPLLFNSLDPSPLIDRDLDAAVESFIVGWARELPHHGGFELLVHVATPPSERTLAGLEHAVQHYFANRADLKQSELRLLLRRGRANLVIGLLFLGFCFGLGVLVRDAVPDSWGEFVELGLHIVGWVAMWRPVEIYLYDWWPVRADLKLLRLLARMPVRVQPSPQESPGKL